MQFFSSKLLACAVFTLPTGINKNKNGEKNFGLPCISDLLVLLVNLIVLPVGLANFSVVGAFCTIGRAIQI